MVLLTKLHHNFVDIPLSFSLDIASATANIGQVDTLCYNDYVGIPGEMVLFFKI